ncbi:MAG: ZIP family metal transporter [Candidatus Nomurabacteria bacterium]|jgi:zinc and cadmium transporter|nr:ZIP family metal transporter [Candidatus Nomurabacteria bacterium]
MLVQVIIWSLVGSVLSLVGGILLLASKKSGKFAVYATAFAAGALLATAFLDLLPEAVETGDARLILSFTMVGLVFFFLLEGGLNWFHSHSHNHAEIEKSHAPMVPMVIFGDTIHNFIDGVAIAAAFLVSPTSGIIVAIAVAAHEIPQEIGDFGIMLHSGMRKSRVILINLLSALVATVSAVIFYSIGDALEISPLLGIVAGFFIYTAATDIIPTIHQEKNRKKAARKSLFLILGIVAVGLMIGVLGRV